MYYNCNSSRDKNPVRRSNQRWPKRCLPLAQGSGTPVIKYLAFLSFLLFILLNPTATLVILLFLIPLKSDRCFFFICSDSKKHEQYGEKQEGNESGRCQKVRHGLGRGRWSVGHYTNNPTDWRLNSQWYPFLVNAATFTQNSFFFLKQKAKGSARATPCMKSAYQTCTLPA